MNGFMLVLTLLSAYGHEPSSMTTVPLPFQSYAACAKAGREWQAAVSARRSNHDRVWTCMSLAEVKQ